MAKKKKVTKKTATKKAATKKKVTKKTGNRKKAVRKVLDTNVTHRYMLALIEGGIVEEIPESNQEQNLLARNIRQLAEKLTRQATRKGDVESGLGGEGEGEE